MEDIAIIGFSLRFPQDAVSPESFWNMLTEGRSAATEVPESRFNINAFYHPDPDRLGSMNCRGGNFLTGDLAAFDAPFFSISPAEAACIDPQQRILLETSYRALENGESQSEQTMLAHANSSDSIAGIPIETISGTKTSVHIGCFSHEYEIMFARDPEALAKYQASGTGPAMLANRLSWFYNLHGPSIALDTACSSSMNALYLAIQNLRSSETNLGIVGGCNLILNPDSVMAPLANMNFLSPDSRCYPFDARANGYSRGEGFGVIIIKRVTDAIADGDTIRSIIRGVGANQDGRTPGITQPNCSAQEAMIRETYMKNDLDIGVTRFFEAHGTGTPVGDLVEARAISAVFKDARSSTDPLFVGAAKSNIGHLEGASGMVSIIKATLALERGIIPPNADYRYPHPDIPAEQWNVKFPRRSTPWPSNGLRRASVNSFGYGGANVHVVLDDARHYLENRNLSGKHNTVLSSAEPVINLTNGHCAAKTPHSAERDIQLEPASLEPQTRLLVWSASDEASLKNLLAAYQQHLSNICSPAEQRQYFEDLCYTLSSRRSLLPWKTFLVCNSLHELRDMIRVKTSGLLRSRTAPVISFVFTGQGAQWSGMGRELLGYPVFRTSLEQATKYLQTLGCSWSLIEELLRDKVETNIDQASFSQPICTALQVALVDLYASWGIIPSAVVGHSSGEIAAAYCIGGLSKESAWRIAYFRGALAATMKRPKRGAMMSVAVSQQEAETYISEAVPQSRQGDLTVGCVNSPVNVTLTGDEDCIDMVKSLMEKKRLFARKLAVQVAYHSKAMTAIASKYAALIENISPRTCEGRSRYTPIMFSSVTGRAVPAATLSQPEYWVENLVSKVRFSEALIATDLWSRTDRFSSNDSKSACIIEIGPHSALRRPVKDTITGLDYISALQNGHSSLNTSLHLAGYLHCKGARLNLPAINNEDGTKSSLRMLTTLPEYPFNHSQRHWVEGRISKDLRFRKHARHELLGIPLPTSQTASAKWRNVIKKVDNPWIRDHKSNDSILYPASGMIVMAIEAMRQLVGRSRPVKGFMLKEIFIHRALLLSLDIEGVETEISLNLPKGSGKDLLSSADFHISALWNEEWADICEGSITTEFEEVSAQIANGNEEKALLQHRRKIHRHGIGRCGKMVESTRNLYEFAAAIGYGFGPTFQTLHGVSHSGGTDAAMTVYLGEWKDKVSKDARITQEHLIHPTTLDGVFQGTIVALTKGATESSPTMVPTRIRSLWISNELLGYSDTDSLSVHSQITFQGFRESEFSILALDTVNDKPCIAIEGYRITAVTNSTNQHHDWRRLCYGIDTKPDIEHLNAKQLEDLCDAALETSKRVPDPVIHDWEVVCYEFMSMALESLSTDGVRTQKPHLRKYIEWMKLRCQQLSEKTDSSFLPLLRKLQHNTRAREQLWSRVEESSPEGRLFVTIGRQLVEMLQERADPLEVLFKDQLLHDFYAGPGMSTNYRKMVAYVDLLAHKNPSMSILEIGAGTGGATSSILNILNDRAESDGQQSNFRYRHYTYTDISLGFFEAAQERFREHSERMSFKPLDISKDPFQQGFEASQYDLIIASAVLHATENIDETLSNTRQLLKPGGKLLLQEPTSLNCIRIPFIFGLLPGWWLAEEPTREWGPTLSEEAWNSAFLKNGYEGTDVCVSDNVDPDLHAMSVLVASTPPSSPNAPPNDRYVILVAHGSSLQGEVASQIESKIKEARDCSCTIRHLQQVEPDVLRESSVVSLLEMDGPILAMISEEFMARWKIIMNLARSALWVTRGGGEAAQDPRMALINGFANTLRSEYHDRPFATIALDATAAKDSIVMNVLRALRTPENGESDYVQQGDMIYISRMRDAIGLNNQVWSQLRRPEPEMEPFASGHARALTLTIASPGLLDSLRFIADDTLSQPLGPSEVLIKAKATGVNFKDIMVAMGQLPEKVLGQECSGIIHSVGSKVQDLKVGDRVCCLVGGAYKTYVRCHISAVSKIPDDYSFTSAAALPVVYCTAYYSLFNIGQLKKGESILIHSAAGGVGQAAITLAQSIGADLYLTVSTEEKKALLMETYGIPSDRFFSSRNTSFALGIKRMTHGRGVDLVLNSLSGDFLKASWECIAPLGRFVEIGKRDIESHARLSMSPFARNVTFASVDLGVVATQAKPLMQEIMTSVMALVTEGTIRPPQPLHVYKGSRIEEAFRYLQSGKNTGKTIVEFHDQDIVPIMPSIEAPWHFDPQATYIITGAFGGLGRSIARWMMKRNARHLLLLSRNGSHSQAAQTLLLDLKLGGVTVHAPKCDIGDEKSLLAGLAHCDTAAHPIKGCIHSAMALKDSIFEKMSASDFHEALNPKVAGTWHLHSHLPQKIDFFVLLSSTGAVIGNAGQANYTSGSAYQDAVARYRVLRGQKCISLNLGLMLSIGYAAEKKDLTQSFKAAGHEGITEAEFHALLDCVCDPSLDIKSPDEAQIVTGLPTPTSLKRKGVDEPSWMKRPLFLPLYEMDRLDPSSSSAAGQTQPQNTTAANYANLLRTAGSLDAASAVATEALVKKLAKTLFVSEEDVDTSRPMSALGIDSLVAIEIRHWFAGELKSDVPVFVILGNECIAEVGRYVAEKSRVVGGGGGGGTSV